MPATIHPTTREKSTPQTLPEALAKIRELEDLVAFQNQCLRRSAPAITLQSEVEQAMVKFFQSTRGHQSKALQA